MNIISDHALPTIAPLDMPQTYGIDGRGNAIDPRAYDFRVIVKELLCCNADMSIPDQDGMTPLHMAAKEGWGDNLDLFFLHDQDRASRLQRTCLGICDDAGLTVLDHARMTGIGDVVNGGEDIIVSEMRKRAMEIPPKPPQPPMMDRKWTIGKKRSPAPTPSHSEASNVPTANSSPQPRAQFPPAQVYQDPEFATSASNSDSLVNDNSRNFRDPRRTQPGAATTPERAEPEHKSSFFKKLTRRK
jgi:hypothetical protein